MSASFSLKSEAGTEFSLYPELHFIPEGAVHEGGSYTFHLRGPSINPFTATLTVDGVVLDRISESPGHVFWKWEVGFHAGIIELEITGLTSRKHSLELITDPHRAKLTRHEYGVMISDILTDSFALAGIAGSHFGIASGAAQGPDIARFEFLRQCLDRVESALTALARNPSLLLESTAVLVRTAHCHSATPIELAKSTRYARKLTAEQLSQLSPAGSRLAKSMRGSLPTSIQVSRRQTTHVRREHADILAILNFWYLFLTRVSEKLLRAQDEDAPSAVVAVQRRCDAMLRRVSNLQKLPIFEEVSPTKGPIGSSQLFRRSPNYRIFFQAYRDFLKGLANVEADFLKIPLRRTFELYELWCFLRIAHAATREAGSAAVFRDAFKEKVDRTGLRLSIEGKPIQVGKFRLLFKPRYNEIWRSTAPQIGSFSRPMEPDMAIETLLQDIDAHAPVIVLDAKYRAETQINDAIVSIHTYRDALVRRVGEDASERTVRAAFVLSPALPREWSDSESWQDVAVPQVFFRREYRNRFRFGAIVIKPGMDICDCQQILKLMLQLGDNEALS